MLSVSAAHGASASRSWAEVSAAMACAENSTVVAMTKRVLSFFMRSLLFVDKDWFF